MASQNINVGTNADDGTGESLRSAFIDIRKMFAEVYNQTYTSDTQDLSGATFDLYSKPDLTLVGNTLTLTKPDATTDTVDLSSYLDEDARAIASGTINGSGIVTFTRDDATTFTLDLSSLLDDTNLITSVNTQTGAVVLDADDIDDTSTTNKFTTASDISKLAGIAAGAEVNTVDSVNTQTGAVVLDSDDISQGSTNLYNQTHTGDVTGSTALTIANDVVGHDQLSARYTEDVSITTYTGSVSFDCSNGSVFKLGGDLSGAYTIDLTNYKKGQIITIYPLKGNQTLNLDAQGSSTNTFNKLGGVDYEDDGTSNNILQIECVDDSSTDPVFFYSLATYASASSDI